MSLKGWAKALIGMTENGAMGRFMVYLDEAKAWRWRLVAGNNHVIADSGESYTRKSDAKEAARRVGSYANNAAIVIVRPETG